MVRPLPSEAYRLAEKYRLGVPQFCFRRGGVRRTFLSLLFALAALYGGYQLALYTSPLLFYYFGDHQGSFYVLGPFRRFDAVFERDGSVIDLDLWARSHWSYISLLVLGALLIVSAGVLLVNVIRRLVKQERAYICAEGFLLLRGRERVEAALRWEQIRELRYQVEELYRRYRIPPARSACIVATSGKLLRVPITALARIINERLNVEKEGIPYS